MSAFRDHALSHCPRLDLPELPRLEQPELVRLYPGIDARRFQRLDRRVDRLVSQLECAVVMAERELRTTHLKRLHGLGRIHVHVAHEPARLIGADRQYGEAEGAVAVTCVAEMRAVAIA